MNNEFNGIGHVDGDENLIIHFAWPCKVFPVDFLEWQTVSCYCISGLTYVAV